MKQFFLSIKNFFMSIINFYVGMVTNPNSADISSKRYNGSLLIASGIVLGFLISFVKTLPQAIEVMNSFLYVGAAILGITIAESFVKKSGDK